MYKRSQGLREYVASFHLTIMVKKKNKKLHYKKSNV